MTNNQTKYGIIYEKIAMQTGDDEQMINYEWPKDRFVLFLSWWGLYCFVNKYLVVYYESFWINVVSSDGVLTYFSIFAISSFKEMFHSSA